MGRIFQPLLFMLARCTRHELIRQIEFLKAENYMLRRRVPLRHIILKPEERSRLLSLGRALGPGVKHLLTIVAYNTYMRWTSDLTKGTKPRKTGRPRTPDEIRELVLKIARETAWGYTRILGELRKLKINVSRQTVVNILKAEGLDPGPHRGPGSWDNFLKRHAETLWQCDFFSKRVLSRLGLPQVWALVFLNVATRRVWVSPSTRNPTEMWVEEQARAFIEHAKAERLDVGLVTRDNDQIYKKGFDRVMKDAGVNARRLALRAPNTNAYVERFIQTIQVECLDHFLVFGEKHLDYLVREYVEHYHEERPHQGLGNRRIEEPSSGDADAEMLPLSTVSRQTRLGGLLSHYRRRAA